jgi:hypothetical protein
MIDVLIDGAGPALGLVAVGLTAFAATFVREWFRSSPPPPRRGGRIPADERRLLGDDWRECLR